MTHQPIARPQHDAVHALRALSCRFRHDDEGSTAIEFAVVLTPFLIFTFGIITLGMHYLATNSLEKAVHDASRQIRTGQAQQANLNANDFKALVCNQAAPHIDCSKLRIHLASFDSWKDVVPPDCIDANTKDLKSGTTGTGSISNQVGGASKKVLVTACYDWTVAKYLPYFYVDANGKRNLTSSLRSGGLLLQASAVFQTEPYE